MLENIKIILDLNDSNKDQLITLYIDKVSSSVLAYCNIEVLNDALESFVEDKVVSIVKSKVTGSSQNTGEVKSVTRGDTRIEYNVANISSVGSGTTDLTDSDRKFLNRFRKVVMI